MTINLLSLNEAINLLKTGETIAYPTESIYGLGCDPDNENAVTHLLKLKRRSIDKGLILIAAYYEQLLKYIDEIKLNDQQRTRIVTHNAIPITWLCPKKKQTYSYLTGRFDTIAVRITSHPVARTLCHRFDKPIVSTSANLSGHPPSRSPEEVAAQFGCQFPIVEGRPGGYKKPSQIVDSLTGAVIRK